MALRSYFGGRLVAQQSGANTYQAVIQDRLGSVGKYYPYGEERNSPQLPNDQVKFATYTRDSATGNDYADQRYYTSVLGRFVTPDPYKASRAGSDPSAPISWNRYSYAIADPINHRDSTGLLVEPPDPGPGPGPDPGPDPTPFPDPGQQRGPGPARNDPSPQRPTGTDVQARGILRQRFNNFAGSNCDKVFNAVIAGYSTADFEASVETTEFYNATDPKVGALTQNQVVGNGVQTTLLNTLDPNDPVAATISSATATAIILGANFISNSDPTFQQNVLLHELLHVYTGGWSDAEIFDAFKKYGLQNVNGGTEDICAWLSTDCKSTPTSLTWWQK